MNYLLYISLLPSIVLGFLIYKNDTVEKEPVSLLLRCFVGGIISAVFVIIFSQVFDFRLNPGLINTFMYSFICVALLEEGFKFIITYLICYKNREFNYMYDGICYASFLSLGFATLENILYVFSTDSILVALARGLATVPAHIFFAIFMGYYLGLAKYYRSKNDKRNEKLTLVKSIIIPIFLHGFFDFCLYTSNVVYDMIFLAFLLYLYSESFRRVRMMGKIRTSLYEN